MIVKFTITVYGSSEDEAQEEMDNATSDFLIAASGRFWECTEDMLYPDPAWVPGEGNYGPTQGFKAHRQFHNRDNREEVKMSETPEQEAPVEEAPAEEATPEEAPEEATEEADDPADDE